MSFIRWTIGQPKLQDDILTAQPEVKKEALSIEDKNDAVPVGTTSELRSIENHVEEQQPQVALMALEEGAKEDEAKEGNSSIVTEKKAKTGQSSRRKRRRQRRRLAKQMQAEEESMKANGAIPQSTTNS